MVYTPVDAVANLRRCILISVGLSIAGIGVGFGIGHPLAGLFFAFGLALGALNTRLLQQSVLTFARGRATKKGVQLGVLMRLGAITLLAIGLGLIVRPDGFGTFAGLAVFQLLLLVGAAAPLLKSMRPAP